MARYNTFKYGTQKYGASTAANLIWGLEVDWDDDGAFSGAIEAGRVVGVSIERGRNYLISSNGDGFNPIQPGRMRVMLENHDGRYDAFNAESPLYPNVEPGRFARLHVRSGANSYTLFNGSVLDIRPSRKTQLAALEVEDGLRWLQDESVSTQIYKNIYAGQAIGAVLDAVQWPDEIWARNIATGADLLDYWWARGRSAMEEIRAVVDSEIGHFFHAAGGTFVFRSRQTNQTATISVNQGQISTDLETPQPWDVRRNSIRVTANVITVGPSVTVWSAPKEIALDPGASLEVIADFGGGVINLVDPVAMTDYTAFSQSNGIGTDLTGSIRVMMTGFAESARIHVINQGSQLAYVNFLQIRGNPLRQAAMTAQANLDVRRPQTLTLDLEWQQDVNNPASFADQLLKYLSGVGMLPKLVIENRPEIQFAVDLFDLVNVDIAALGISGIFRVGSIRHEWMSSNGQAVRTTWKLEPYQSYDYWRFPVTFNTTSILGW
jgi:hypothetical protein